MPFDDGVENITQNGLLADLRVSNVEYIVGSTAPVYVQSLQLELQQGGQSWFLQRHGKFGSADPWEVVDYQDQGQVSMITAVQVRWCDYVDSLTFYTSEGDAYSIGGLGGCRTTMVNFQEQARQQCNVTTGQAWLVGLLGRSQKWINSVGFYFAYLAPPGEACHCGIVVPSPAPTTPDATPAPSPPPTVAPRPS
jgi:hypothetical protein